MPWACDKLAVILTFVLSNKSLMLASFGLSLA